MVVLFQYVVKSQFPKKIRLRIAAFQQPVGIEQNFVTGLQLNGLLTDGIFIAKADAGPPVIENLHGSIRAHQHRWRVTGTAVGQQTFMQIDGHADNAEKTVKAFKGKRAVEFVHYNIG